MGGVTGGESKNIGAWGDESMRLTKVQSPMYLLGAALADEVTAVQAREAMLGIHKRVRNSIGEILTHEPRRCLSKLSHR